MVNFTHVYVPRVHWELTSKRVLTAEWIDGCRVTDKAAILNKGLNLADERYLKHDVLKLVCEYRCMD